MVMNFHYKNNDQKMILSVENIRKSEQFTMAQEPIASIDLMERAGASFVQHLLQAGYISQENKIAVFCGQGNNGGDGLVIARLLAQNGFATTAVLCTAKSNATQDYLTNLERIKTLSIPSLKVAEYSSELMYSFHEQHSLIVIDALFGIGISKPLTGYFATIVQAINELHVTVIAVDVPSGLFSDQHTPADYMTIHASYTCTFQFMKLAYLLPENEKRVGKSVVLDIGLQLPPELKSDKILITGDIVQSLIVPSSKFSHKGSNGHGLLIAGSTEMPGAALLAAKAAMRSGIGKVTLHTPSAVLDKLATFLPEGLQSKDNSPHCFSGIDLHKFSTITAIAIGTGLGQRKETASALSALIDEVKHPLILDADALNILGENKTWLAYLPENSILTPHFKEFDRLAGTALHDFDRLERLKNFTQRYHVIVILKGAHSVVAMPDEKLFFNTTGNQGMATAGSGDVLTGILLAFMAKGYPSEIAAILACYLHGLVGDLAVQKRESYESLIASDLIDFLGVAFKKLIDY